MQYTARYHSPQMTRLLLESQLEWLLKNPRALEKLGDTDSRHAVQQRILTEQFFPKLQELYAKHRETITGINPDYAKKPPVIEDISAVKARVVPELPHDIVTHRDDYNIVGFHIPKESLKHLPPAGSDVYVAIETRRYIAEETPGKAVTTRLEREPVTLVAERTNAVFSGRNSHLTLAPRIHSSVVTNGDDGGRVGFNLFVQMTSAGNKIDGFYPSGAPAALFERENRFIDVGHKVHAIVEKSLVDPIVVKLQQSLTDAGKKPTVEVTPNWVIGQLVNQKLISYVDATELRAAHKEPAKLDKLSAELFYEATKPQLVVDNTARGAATADKRATAG